MIKALTSSSSTYFSNLNSSSATFCNFLVWTSRCSNTFLSSELNKRDSLYTHFCLLFFTFVTKYFLVPSSYSSTWTGIQEYLLFSKKGTCPWTAPGGNCLHILTHWLPETASSAQSKFFKFLLVLNPSPPKSKRSSALVTLRSIVELCKEFFLDFTLKFWDYKKSCWLGCSSSLV